ncbi:MAG TPA: phasin family protein [Hyphomicrobiaceae bacterium]|nr:phasin family protein [Hyphomicrobiaceae bacterium]
MMNGIGDFQKLGQSNVDAAMKMFGEFTRGWQAIAAEFSDYSKRSFEDGTQTMEKLMAAKSLEQAVDIQSKYVKRSYDEYMHQIAKVGSMYAELAKEAYRPMEKLMQQSGR